MANISIRIDDDTKNSFDKFCSNVGISVSAAFNLFAKKVVREHRIPFDITDDDPFYSEENQARLAASLKHAQEGKVTEHELIEA